MKKLLLLTLILCLVLPCFGCNQGDLPPAGDGTTDGTTTEETLDPLKDIPLILYPCYVEDVTGDGVLNLSDGLWRDYRTDKALESKTVELFGEQYTVDYKYTSFTTGYKYKTDVYRQKYLDVEFREDTGELKYFYVTGDTLKNLELQSSATTLSREEIVDLGEQFAKDYIDDLSEYERTIGEAQEITYQSSEYQKSIAYKVTYQKKIQGLTTLDYFSVTITTHGNVQGMSIGDIGSFDDMPADLDVRTLQKRAMHYARDLYEQRGYTVREMEYRPIRLGYTPDGKLCLIAELRSQISEDATKETGVAISLVIE